jgi:diacylglycerol O-acyltransferase
MGEYGRLHALDLAWLEMQGDGPPIAIGTVALTDGPPPSEAELAALLADRLPRMPALHQQVDSHGHGIRRPTLRWAAGLPDLPGHIHRLAAGQGASLHPPLDGAVARIMEARLPGDRPMWDAWIVDGLPGDRWALVWRVHHSISDGIGALLLLGHGFDLSADGTGPTLADAVTRRATSAAAPREGPAPSSPRRALHALRSVAAHGAPAVASLVPHSPGPLTAAVGHSRAWASVEVPLGGVKEAGRAFGVTVNDVVLAAVAGGFRDLMAHRGLRVGGQVVRNLVPVSLRPAGDDGAGNHISALLGHLPVGVADPVERLREIHAGVDHGREVGEPALASLLLGVVDRAVPSALQDAVVATAGRTVPAWFFDTLTTNVPGPQFPAFLLGRRVRALFPVIPVAGHTAITTGIFSYDGMLDIGVTGDGQAARDVDVLARGIARAAGELVAAGGADQG